jgi:hypothetical protein
MAVDTTVTCRGTADPFSTDEGDWIDCECQDVAYHAENLAEIDLERLDHVSVEVMKTTCSRWRDGWGHDPYESGDRVPCHLTGSLWTAPLQVGQFYMDVWPVPLLNSAHELLMVLTEWAEEPPNERLGRILQELPQWRAAERAIIGWYSRYAESGCVPGWWRLQPVLEEYGLPASPTTAEWIGPKVAPEWFAQLYATLDKESPPPLAGPARGIRVVSFALGAGEWDDVEHGIMVHRVEAVSPWVTDELLREANRIAMKHARWWKGLPQTRSMPSDLRRHNSRPPDNLTLLCRERHSGKLADVEFYEMARQIRREKLRIEELTSEDETHLYRELKSRMRKLDIRINRRT